MIHLTESELKHIIRNTLKETLTKALYEKVSPEDKLKKLFNYDDCSRNI